MNKGIRKYMILGAAALLVLVLVILGIKGCGVSHKSPERVVEELVKASVKGNTGRMEDCYAVDKLDKEGKKLLQETLKAKADYYQAHDPQKVEITECKTLYEEEKYVYVYAVFNLVLANEQKYPCIDTFMVKKSDKKYYVLPASEITEELSQRAATEYAAFMATDTYKNYTKAYDAFIKKNPGYEDKIAGKVNK